MKKFLLLVLLLPLLVMAQSRIKTGGVAGPTVNGEYWAGVDQNGVARPMIGMNSSGLVTIDPDARGISLVGTPNFTTGIEFEGATANAFETTLTAADPTADRTVTLPDASITVNGEASYECGTSAACSPSNVSTSDWSFTGSCALTSASPSTCSVTAMSPAFTSSSTYWCTATPNGTTAAIAAAGVAINRTSGSAFTITGPDTVTTVISWQCKGH